MNQKLQWLRNKMSSLDMQGIIISNPINIKYLTNIDAEGTLVITPKENMYITDGRYIEYVHSILTLFDEIIVYDVNDLSKDDYENIFMFCENVGFEEHYISYATYKEYIRKYKIHNFVETEYIIEKQRMIKDDDELITVKKSTDQVILITKHGYYLRYNSLEIPLVGPKASGVKGINLKDDEVVFGGTIDIDDIYLNIFTNNKTAKRLKITDLDIASRAKRGSTLIKKTKTVNYEITHVLLTNSKDEICIKSDSEIKNLKNSDIPIMDISSTGSAISKYNIDDAFKVTSLKTFMNNKEENDTKEEVIEKTDTQVKQQSLDDFIEDFKL